jgi:hypothetical protein
VIFEFQASLEVVKDKFSHIYLCKVTDTLDVYLLVAGDPSLDFIFLEGLKQILLSKVFAHHLFTVKVKISIAPFIGIHYKLIYVGAF